MFCTQQGGHLMPIPCPVRGSAGADVSYGGDGGLGGGPNSNIFSCTKVNVFFCTAEIQGPSAKAPYISIVTNSRVRHALTGK